MLKQKGLLFILLVTIFYKNICNDSEFKNKLNNYLLEFNYIEGWFDRPFVDFLIKLDNCQKDLNINGNLAEIGVFHGKSFIPLYLIARPEEKVLAVDCFDNQEYNYDNSGPYCKRNSFMENVKTFCDKNLSKLETIQGDASKLTSQDYLEKMQNKKFRIFSIDGCHLSKETYIDLNNAFQCLEDGGIIIVDDFFNYYWPGVSEGVTRFLIDNDKIKPFFIGYNKLILTHVDYIEKYISVLKSFRSPKKETVYFGSSLVIY